MPLHRRHLLHTTLASGLALAVYPLPLFAAARAPFRRLAVIDPPFVEEYEVLIATAPPLLRGTLGTLITQAVTRNDAQLKTERLTHALDPDLTRLHEHFVQALAEALDEADVKVLLVPVQAARDEAALFDQVRKAAPQADAVLLANVMGRFVALHGLTAYVPGVMVGIKAQNQRGDKVWLEKIFSAGFRGIDPRAEHLESVLMPQRFDDAEALLAQVRSARQALIQGVEGIAAEVARRLMAGNSK